MLETSYTAWSTQWSCLQASSKVFATLVELGLEPVEGLLLSEGLIRVDIALPASKIAFSLDDKACFSSNIANQPLGEKMLEWRFLALMQWQV